MPHQSPKYSQDIHGPLRKDIESLVRVLYEKNKESAIQKTVKDVRRTLKRHKIDSEYSTDEETDSDIVDLRAQLEEVKRAKEAQTERANKAEAEKDRAKKAESEMKMMKEAETERAERAETEMERTKKLYKFEKDKAIMAEEYAKTKIKKAESEVKEMNKKRDVYLKGLRDKQLELTKALKDVDFYKSLSKQFQQKIKTFGQQLIQITDESLSPQTQNTITDNSIISDIKEEPESDEEEDSEEYKRSEDGSEDESEDEDVRDN